MPPGGNKNHPPDTAGQDALSSVIYGKDGGFICFCQTVSLPFPIH
jgi:hypothetical protein